MNFTPPLSPSASPIHEEIDSESQGGGDESVEPENVAQLQRAAELRFSSLSGLRDVKLALFVAVLLPLSSPPANLPIVLLHGPPGTGKSSLCRCVAGELGELELGPEGDFKFVVSDLTDVPSRLQVHRLLTWSRKRS